MATLSLGRGSIRGGFERVVRPNVTLESHLRDRTPAPVEVPEQEAEIRWGKPSSFQFSTTNIPPTNGGGIIVRPGGGDDDNPDEGPQQVTITFEEIPQLTITEDVRIENPDDAQQYVIESRILDIQFLAPPELPDAITGLHDGSISELLTRYVLKPRERPPSSNAANPATA